MSLPKGDGHALQAAESRERPAARLIELLDAKLAWIEKQSSEAAIRDSARQGRDMLEKLTVDLGLGMLR